MSESHFDSIESAQRFVALLHAQVEEVRSSLCADFDRATAAGETRQLDALRLVDYKLHQLDRHLQSSSRLLNDLRALRRLLSGERAPQPTKTQ
jgi:hypothetical protein